jgi:hypothetical protein
VYKALIVTSRWHLISGQCCHCTLVCAALQPWCECPLSSICLCPWALLRTTEYKHERGVTSYFHFLRIQSLLTYCSWTLLQGGWYRLIGKVGNNYCMLLCLSFLCRDYVSPTTCNTVNSPYLVDAIYFMRQFYIFHYLTNKFCTFRRQSPNWIKNEIRLDFGHPPRSSWEPRFFGGIMKQVLIIRYRRFGTCRFQIQWSKLIL